MESAHFKSFFLYFFLFHGRIRMTFRLLSSSDSLKKTKKKGFSVCRFQVSCTFWDVHSLHLQLCREYSHNFKAQSQKFQNTTNSNQGWLRYVVCILLFCQCSEMILSLIIGTFRVWVRPAQHTQLLIMDLYSCLYIA